MEDRKIKILICGTRKKGYGLLVRQELDKIKLNSDVRWKDFEIVEGCCPDSADTYAEKWAIENAIKVNHFPSKTGNYLKRNVEMVKLADTIIAFWDGWSYGTAHTIATAISLGKKVEVMLLK